MTEWLTPAEAAVHLKVSRNTIYRWTKTGRLKVYRPMRNIRISVEELESMGNYREPSALEKELDQRPWTLADSC
jgi:excisionase family DNA binding protein